MNVTPSSPASAPAAAVHAAAPYFSVEMPAVIRCNVVAASEQEARDILRALYGSGDWAKIMSPGHAVHAAVKIT